MAEYSESEGEGSRLVSDYSYSYGSEDDLIESDLDQLSVSAGSPVFASKTAPAGDTRAASSQPKESRAASKPKDVPKPSAKSADEYEYTYSEPALSDVPSPVHSLKLSPTNDTRSQLQMPRPAATSNARPPSTNATAAALLPAAPASQFDVCIAPPSGLVFEYDDEVKKLTVLSVTSGSSADGVVLPVRGHCCCHLRNRQ